MWRIGLLFNLILSFHGSTGGAIYTLNPLVPRADLSWEGEIRFREVGFVRLNGDPLLRDDD
jgi:hypothetical protein